MSINDSYFEGLTRRKLRVGRTRLDDAGRIAQHVACRGCGYDLRGLDPYGRCSECGADVEPSLAGEALDVADPAWLRRLSVGTLLLMLVVAVTAAQWVLAILGGLGGVAMMAGNAVLGWVWVGLTVATVAAAIAGAWLATSPEPHAGRQTALRQAARIVLMLAFAGMLMPWVGFWLRTGGPLEMLLLTLTALSLLAYVAGPLLLLAWFNGLAHRAGADQMAQSTWKYGWALLTWWALAGLLTLFGFGGAGCLLIPYALVMLGFTLVMLVWGLLLLNQYRALFAAAANAEEA